MEDERSGGLYATVVARPVAVVMVFLAALVFGWVSYARLPVELMPDVSYPTITVRTAFEGAAPQEVEAQVSEPIEQALATLDGLVTLESRSRAGNSDVVLGFDWDADMAAASQAIREALQVTTLPEGAGRPLILRYDPSLEPFLRFALSYDPETLKVSPEQGLYLLRDVAEREVQRALEGMKGVAAVRVRGGLERELRVEVREDWLAARGLKIDDVKAALVAENVNLAGGSVLEGDTEYLVRTLNEFHGLDDLRVLRLRRADGVLVPLTDVAVLSERPKERTVLSHLDGAEAVELEVFKEADANVVEVARQVKQAVLGRPLDVDPEAVEAMPPGPQRDALQAMVDDAKGLAADLPDGVRIAVLDDQATFIEQAIANLRDSVLLGGLLSIVVLWLFLRDLRATAVIGLSIPVSLLVAFAALYLGGVSLNLMSLGGLALGVGMLVDNAVVVLESIQVRVDAGEDRHAAAAKGTAEVAAAVFASTLTTVAVFAPIGFVEGIGGELFGDLSLAVVGSLLASLAVALFLVPTLAAVRLQPSGVDLGAAPELRLRGVLDDAKASFAEGRGWCAGAAWRRPLIVWVALRFLLGVLVLGALELARVGILRGGRGLVRVGGWALRPLGRAADGAAGRFLQAYARFAAGYGRAVSGALRRPGTVLGVAALVTLAALPVGARLGTQLIPEVHQGRFTLDVALPVGTPLARTAEVVARAEAIAGAHDEVEAVYTTIGSEGRADARADEGEHTARIRVQLKPGGDLAEREARVMDDLRTSLGDEGLALRISRPELFSFRTPLEVVVTGQDLDRLRAVGDEVAAALAAEPGLTDVRTSLTTGHPEVQVAYDRARLARFGLDTATIAARVRDLVQGVQATEVRRDERRIDLRVQLVDDQRGSLADLRRLNVNPAVNPPVPLDAVATFTEALGPSEIRRVDQQRAVVVSAGLEGFDMGAAVDRLEGVMRRMPLDAGATWSLGGQARELGGALTSLGFVLALALFLVYVVMASTFEHLLHPFVILFTVPLAVVGVVGGLAVAGLPVSVVALLGVVVLAGVVVNNAIVLVDAINRLRADGLERLEAIRTAASTRLRPILVTTGTTVLGLLPLALGFGAGAEVQQPLAVAVMGGLTTSTLLTLLVIPAIYALTTGGARAAPEAGP